MKLIELNGDLFKTDASALAHGVNTQGLMGAGIAIQFKRAFPEMYVAYKAYCKQGKLAPGDVYYWTQESGTAIYNIASQDQPGRNARLEWLEEGVVESIHHAERNQIEKIAMPRIGCGIGGLLWEDVRDILEHYAEKSVVDIEVWTL